jgi:hypothetical protein
MNGLLTTVAAAVLGSAPNAARSPEPAVTVSPLNPTTTLLIAPASGQLLIALEAGGGGALLIVNQSPSLAVPLTDANLRATSGVTLLTGLR